MEVLCSSRRTWFLFGRFVDTWTGCKCFSFPCCSSTHYWWGNWSSNWLRGIHKYLLFPKWLKHFQVKKYRTWSCNYKRTINSFGKDGQNSCCFDLYPKSFHSSSTFPALEDADLILISKIASLISLHNQRARLLVKRQLTEILIGFSSAEGISFAQLISTLNCLLSESLSLGEFTSKEGICTNSQVAWWYFRPDIFEGEFDNFYWKILSIWWNTGKARMLSLLAVFSLGSGDGRFVTYTRPVFEQLALIGSFENPQATSAFLFLTLNENCSDCFSWDGDLYPKWEWTAAYLIGSIHWWSFYSVKTCAWKSITIQL